MNMMRVVKPFEREFWEHRGAFVVTPFVLATIASLLFIFALAIGSNWVDQYTGHINNEEPILQEDRSQEVREFASSDTVVGEVDDVVSKPNNHWSEKDAHEINEGVKAAHTVPYMVLGVVMLIIAFTYALGALFTDRKDRSILFWKSLPVSETQTVVTKLIVASLLVPVISWVAASLFNLAAVVLLVIAAAFSDMDGAVGVVLAEQQLFSSAFGLLGAHLAYGLWILPVFSYGLFISALAKKNPFLTGVLPLLVIAFAERVLFGSYYLVSTIKTLLAGKPLSDAPPVLAQGDWWALVHVLTSTGFWVGAVVSAGFIAGAIWLRNHRYEI